jgi:hypothetical protein
MALIWIDGSNFLSIFYFGIFLGRESKGGGYYFETSWG